MDKSRHMWTNAQTKVDKCGQMWTNVDKSGWTQTDKRGQMWTDVDKHGQQGQTWTNTHVCSLCPCPVPNGKWC